MAETQRTYAQVMALLADNTVGAISPQDLRDSLYSWYMPMGQIYMPAGSGVAETISSAGTYVELTSSGWLAGDDAELFDMSAGTGRLTYTGTVPVMCHVALSLSFTTSSNNIVVKGRIGVNDTPSGVAEFQRKIGTGSDVGSTAVHYIASLTAGDYLSAWVTTASGTTDLTLQAANLQAAGIVM